MGFPFIRQSDSMQCGVASLAMVCRHFGMRYSSAFLSSMLHASKEGVSMKGIKETAAKLGLDAVAVRTGFDGIGNCPLPAILLWNQNHYVVLFKISGNGTKYHVADPAKGIITYSADEFLQHWTGAQGGSDGKGIAML